MANIFQTIEKLVRERQTHMDALARIEQTLNGIRAMLKGGSASVPRKPGRPAMKAMGGWSSSGGKSANGSEPKTLAEHLGAIMSAAGNPVAISDLVRGVEASGYKTKSKNLRPVVSQILLKDKRFKRAGRGVYKLR